MKIIIKATIKAVAKLQVQINEVYEYSINQHLNNNLWTIDCKNLGALDVILSLIHNEKNIKLWDVIR